jgi:hypothetical protein
MTQITSGKSMTKTNHFNGVIVTRDIDPDGYVHAYDKNNRICWDSENTERVVLVHDLRVYGNGLHIGQLGWTVPATTDGYKAVDVLFDTGQSLTVSVHALERVVSDMADEISLQLIEKWRNTRFDADPLVAATKREEWIDAAYGKYISLAEATRLGTGDQELYAFTFPTLREIATLKRQPHYPIKIGYSKNASSGALGRIRQQITENAAYPERPLVLCLYRTWDGRDLEKQVHRALRDRDRKVDTSLGVEWYLTSKEELLEVLRQCEHAACSQSHPVTGADETIDEGFSALMVQGATLEFGTVPGSACVRFGIKLPKKEELKGDDVDP